jgi:hypothetical protein
MNLQERTPWLTLGGPLMITISTWRVKDSDSLHSEYSTNAC